MHIEKSYKYEINGIVYISGNLPEGATVIKEMDILTAEEGYTLFRKSDNEEVSTSVWLREGDSEENYEEREIKDDGEY